MRHAGGKPRALGARVLVRSNVHGEPDGKRDKAKQQHASVPAIVAAPQRVRVYRRGLQLMDVMHIGSL